MSLATLKKKTNNGNPRISPISGKGKLGFALNGTLRVPSMGKTTNLGRRDTRTPFRGTEPMGNGGGWRGRLNIPTAKVGTYTRNISFNNFCCNPNNPDIIKTSVKNNRGMIETRYMGTLHGAYPKNIITDEDGNPIIPPINWVQPIDSEYLKMHTQGQYISAKRASNDSITNYMPYNENGFNSNLRFTCNSGFPCVWFVGSKKLIVGHGVSYSSGGAYTKTLIGPGAISQGQYIQGAFLKYKNNLPTTLSKRHFPMNLIRNGCDVNAVTIEQAIAKGLMSKYHEMINCNRDINGNLNLCLHHHRYTLASQDKKYFSNILILSFLNLNMLSLLYSPSKYTVIVFIADSTPHSTEEEMSYIEDNIFTEEVIGNINEVYNSFNCQNKNIMGVLYKDTNNNDCGFVNNNFSLSDISSEYLNVYLPIGNIIAFGIYKNSYKKIPVKINNQ